MRIGLKRNTNAHVVTRWRGPEITCVVLIHFQMNYQSAVGKMSGWVMAGGSVPPATTQHSIGSHVACFATTHITKVRCGWLTQRSPK
jgi:hypothetical protein